MTPRYIATEPFTPDDPAWNKYIEWSGLTHLKELVSLDPILCPSALKELKPDYWPHIVNEDFMLDYFVDFEYLYHAVENIPHKNVLCVFRNPLQKPVPPSVAKFEFLGYDLVDVENSASALSNCGGFPDVFANSELSHVGLLPELSRASEVQALLRSTHPEEFHANCHLWAVFRMRP